MFDFSWSEILVIGAVALVVIGPKDLPKALRTAGALMRRARMAAREFQNTIDDVIREADLEDAERSYRDAIAQARLPDFKADHPAIASPVAAAETAPAPGAALVEAPPPSPPLHELAEPLSADPIHPQHPPAP